MNQITAKHLSLTVDKSPNESCSHTNYIYVDLNSKKYIPKNKIVTINCFMFHVASHSMVSTGSVALNNEQRYLIYCSLLQKVNLRLEFAEYICLSVTFEISWFFKNNARRMVLNADQLRSCWFHKYSKVPLNLNQKYHFLYNGNYFILQIIELKGGMIGIDSEINPVENIYAAICKQNITKMFFERGFLSQIIIEDDTLYPMPTILRPEFNFKDLEIGGLSKEFSTLFRRAFNSRLYPPKFIRDRGIKHVKGILLYGPPGTGKTLMARQIGKMLNSGEPEIVNGPEVLDKMYGEAERKIRNLFSSAEFDQQKNGDSSKLHLVIFDEFDSICRKRGGSGTLSGVQDSLVNQLLAKIDGVDSLNNVLLIAMTNRKDLIDEALLRPGRLEVQLMIGLPNEAGREQIFDIHSKKLREFKGMADDVDLKELAQITPNYTGAEIEGVIKCAQSYSLNDGYDPKTFQLKNDVDLKVTREHFMLALKEVRPAFGVEEDVEKLVPRGIVDFSIGFKSLKKNILQFVDSLMNSNNISLMSFCINGIPGCGLTSFAVSIAKTGFDYVKMILARNFIGRTESQISSEILNIFENAYKSKSSAIVIDDIDSIIEFSPIGPRFSNKIFHSFLVLLKQNPPPGSKLAIFTTTSKREEMSMIGLDSRYFYEEISLDPVKQVCQLQKIAKKSCHKYISIGSLKEEKEVNDYLSKNQAPIKRVIESIDFAAFEAKDDVIQMADLFKILKKHIK